MGIGNLLELLTFCVMDAYLAESCLMDEGNYDTAAIMAEWGVDFNLEG